ncbi:MAG: hypothetical protein ACOX69_11320 [Coriobacteriales bacterium]|jgi:hypothetical protein
MKRNILINNSRNALIITDDLNRGIELIAEDSALDEEIFAFDTYLHVCYCFKNAVNGCKVEEEGVPLLQFRSFSKYLGNNPTEIYKALIKSLIKL